MDSLMQLLERGERLNSIFVRKLGQMGEHAVLHMVVGRKLRITN